MMAGVGCVCVIQDESRMVISEKKERSQAVLSGSPGVLNTLNTRQPWEAGFSIFNWQKIPQLLWVDIVFEPRRYLFIPKSMLLTSLLHFHLPVVLSYSVMTWKYLQGEKKARKIHLMDTTSLLLTTPGTTLLTESKSDLWPIEMG